MPILNFFLFLIHEKKLGYKRLLRKNFQDTCSRWSYYRIAPFIQSWFLSHSFLLFIISSCFCRTQFSTLKNNCDKIILNGWQFKFPDLLEALRQFSNVTGIFQPPQSSYQTQEGKKMCLLTIYRMLASDICHQNSVTNIIGRQPIRKRTSL